VCVWVHVCVCGRVCGCALCEFGCGCVWMSGWVCVGVCVCV
jgi:hypothetical protein